ncbi:MAG TPA: OmpH family outer membrane protein [Agitococcus sp.]|nr:OmpH family outer membrane protein [Agitococcus sp.]HMY81541.1 OmpH family outer membrane protein [Agitococcus sp.]HNC02164.1 OmpH family outer membrane protein [Agitococcus sp.]HNC85765.1 OmpH family outer membrane protein [Agitococcus sp.]HNE90571.1 OmpH family outer membrane protein [Agitococcus sp.]
MRLASYLIAGLLTTIAMPALAGNVAVADSQAAIMATETAKKTFEKLNNDMKPQRDRLEQLRKDIAAIEEKFQKNASVMSDKDKRDLQKQAESKLNEFKNLADAVQKRANEVQQEMLKTLIPKTEVVVEEIRKAGNYDIIIEKKNVIFADPAVDITKKITEKLNAAK